MTQIRQDFHRFDNITQTIFCVQKQNMDTVEIIKNN
jgi:hypothetical protein